MNIGLIDVDSRHYPNFALMRLSAWHKVHGDNAERFLCYNEDLVRDFYMMPRKEDEK